MAQLKIRWWNFKVIFEDHKGVEFSRILTYATDDPFEVRKILENETDTIKIKGVLCIGEKFETWLRIKDLGHYQVPQLN